MNKNDLSDLHFAINELENIVKKLYRLDPNKCESENSNYYKMVDITVSRARKAYDNLRNK